ncbi:uncharacterized [Tachysurus ichikawai]
MVHFVEERALNSFPLETEEEEAWKGERHAAKAKAAGKGWMLPSGASVAGVRSTHLCSLRPGVLPRASFQPPHYGCPGHAPDY